MMCAYFRSGVGQPESTSHGQHSYGLFLSSGRRHYGLCRLPGARLEVDAAHSLLARAFDTVIHLVSDD